VNIDEARGWLDDHVNLEQAGLGTSPAPPTLERMQAVVELLGSPQLEFPSVHLTGTNGKSSTARMLSALLTATDLSVGSYTSPHLERVNERLAWCGAPISDEALAETLARVALVEAHVPERPTYFEILTAAALSWFADLAVQVAVVEVGLGGRWDATNVIDGEVAVVTNVSIDHVEYLGSSAEGIAAEKAGIVKPGAVLVLGETDPMLSRYFLDRGAAEVWRRGADFGVRGNRMAHGGRVMELFTPGRDYPEVFLPLHGRHQAENAALALAGAEAVLGRVLPDELVREAFTSVTSPGRLEVLGHQPLVLLDGAHNVAGAQALLVALAEEFAPAPRTLVVGLLREKSPHEMLEALDAPHGESIVCTRPPSPRALDPLHLAEAARELGLASDRVAVVDDVDDAVQHAIGTSDPDGQVVVTGSLYVAGAARAALRARGGEAPSAHE